MQVNSLIKRQNNWKSSSNEKGLKMGLPLDNYRLRILSGNKEQNITGFDMGTGIHNTFMLGQIIEEKLMGSVAFVMGPGRFGRSLRRLVELS
jgi:hypothetical protein